jgi:putative Holliday junction resolvase
MSADMAGVRTRRSSSIAPGAAGTVLAFDFGERYLGVAVGEMQTRLAHPLATIEGSDAEHRFSSIATLMEEWQPKFLVVGLPLSSEGETHELTRRARRFARQLEGRFGLPVRLVDERFTSADAGEKLRAIGRGGRRGKALTHPIAAQTILQAFFDEQPA